MRAVGVGADEVHGGVDEQGVDPLSRLDLREAALDRREHALYQAMLSHEWCA